MTAPTPFQYRYPVKERSSDQVLHSVDDGGSSSSSRPVSNEVVFHDAQAAIGAAVLSTHYALTRGRNRRTRARGVSMTGEQTWDLLDVARQGRGRQTAERERGMVAAGDKVNQMWRRRA
ncbi:hypothetical protein E3T34_01090 [Cryobacterium sp. TMT1-62]|uniref:hypothetical protein n=1 Tax=Cryobacterium sp. TMT1-62 TaxID=1259240 RepID=UPI00106B96C7|nr:hypothetical protein [Cryobacterium sp. TMT1-62]TFD36298.1 hypothetical protein E3T34_01090 [Cryobacterium sp. TMT1-62]